jgi:lipopolysaccharide transport system ATP-binding protein
MYMRLAFAVAAHLDPDVLVVDEVLSVGDAEFQAKSLGKMREVSGQGRTVLFVSHNMTAIRTLCDRALLLDEGRIAAAGAVEPVVTKYLAEAAKASESGVIDARATRIGTGEARLARIELRDRNGETLRHAFLGQHVTAILTADVFRSIPDAAFELGISTVDGVRLATSFSTDGNRPPYELEPGRLSVSLDLDLILLPGHYTLDLGVHHAAGGRTADFVEHIFDFEVLNISESGDDSFPVPVIRGYVRPPGRWGAVEQARDPAAVRVG